MSVTVTRLAVTAVKGLRLSEVPEVELAHRGALGDRAFYLVDERGRMVNGKQIGALQTVSAGYERAERKLTLTFADGSSVSDAVEAGAPMRTTFFSREREARLVLGPFAAALSAHIGRPLRLVEPDLAVDRGLDGAVSMISGASLGRLAEAAGWASVDPRRFRMLIEVDGVTAHEEDGWVGRTLRIGTARVKGQGHAGRCLITSRDPETGVIDLPTLDVLRGYRGQTAGTEPLPFGIHGRVLEPGMVRVGDPVVLEA